ncbi:hypothetical protein TanjilG_00717 [Lupinus angustifolius]|uniref:Late embryogenesis abundant protein LEA-2 subgroup domain-containing protein n=1 Tax=Lupinus angustifolius TaxID=3871 RepID=A0A4P1R7D7_LUPAN|nr:PREDICTED: protein YLS9-like [Lupinus angustifolius]OIW04157.1 hypothetical protein TanjilG_00717 [Lupinus angustifolius]
MGDRVDHPPDSALISPQPESPPSRPPTKPASAPPRTYVVKIPKDQVYRVPPPENAQKFNQLATPNTHRCRCHWCFWFTGILFTLISLLALTAAIFYLVVRPKALEYSIDSIDIRGFNMTSISPEFHVTFRANNPNRKIGFHYEKNSSVEIYFKDVMLCNGVLPEFYQPSNNLTVFKTTLQGNVIKLRSREETEMVKVQSREKVPLTVKLIAPLKITVGFVKTGKITVKVDCDVTVDKLAPGAKIVSMHCYYRAYVLWAFKI